MILHCDTLFHPMQHNGTQERDRLLLSLLPDQLKIDDTKQTILLSASGDNGPRIEIDGKGSKISIVLNNSTSIELSSSGVKVSGSRIDLN